MPLVYMHIPKYTDRASHSIHRTRRTCHTLEADSNCVADTGDGRARHPYSL
nr:unnamed protein product [Callosobruchus analis]